MTHLNVAELAVVFVVGTAAVIDVRTCRIPNALTLSAIVAALVYHGLAGVWPATVSAVGLAVGTLIFLPFFALGGLGAGDVKLLGAIGAWLGPTAVLSTALYTSIAGGVMAVGVAC